MESAVKLGDMGYRVLVVEKEPSIGGKMILLSKVFPTLDCASCISTPKMAATAHHPQVTVLTQSEVTPRPRRRRTAASGPPCAASARFVDEAALHRLPRSVRRPARWPSPTSSTARWSRAGPPTSRSPRRSRRRP